MNIPNRPDFEEKKRRLRAYMEKNGYGAVLLGRRDNTAWLTGGGDFKILRDMETAFGVLLVTMDNVYLIAQYMDMGWISDDELQGLDIEKVMLYWYEDSREQKAVKIAGNVRIASDMLVPGTELKLWDIYWMHYPLTDNEIERYRIAAKRCDEMVYDIANRIRPSMSEHEIAAEILYDYAKEDMTMKVLLVSSDERIAKYRHPNPSPKKLEKLALLHPAAGKGGLHVNITRMVYFGETLPEELKRNYDLLNLLEAQYMAMTRPGEKFMALLEERKRIFSEYGMPDEWKYHYPGVITGYILGSAQPFIDNETIRDRMSAEYFITVSGAKVEEVCISGAGGAELISAGHTWPVKEYRYKDNTYKLPIILQR